MKPATDADIDAWGRRFYAPIEIGIMTQRLIARIEADRKVIEAARREIVCTCHEDYKRLDRPDPECPVHSRCVDTAAALEEAQS